MVIVVYLASVSNRAVSLFEEDGYTWNTVVKAFASKDLDEEVALTNARLARILTQENYDARTRTVIPWNPADASVGSDNGAELQDKTA